ncbi:MAG: hypothetical protein K6356_03130, partial [Chloroflexus sp.]
MEHLPPWLRNVPLPPPPADDDTPEWLRGIDSLTPSPPPPSAAAPPAWLTASDPAATTSEIPDWLAELQEEVNDPLANATPMAWLGDETPESLPDRPASFGATSWLQSLTGSPASEAQPVEPPTTSSRVRKPIGPTDWLRSIGHEEESEPPQATVKPEPEPVDPAAGVPDWLRELSEEEITEAFATSSSEPSVSSEQAPAATTAESALESWLQELDAIAPTVAATPSDWATGIAANDETVLATNLPEWMSSDQPRADQAGQADLPAWLQNVAGDEPSAASGSVRLDLPTWLLDDKLIEPPSTTTPPVAPDAPTMLADSNFALRGSDVPEVSVPDWLIANDEPTEQPQASEAEPIPDWLLEAEQQLQSAKSVVEPPASTEPTAIGDIPTWLREADASDLSAWETSTSDQELMTGLREEAPASSDVPAWSREEAPASGEAPAWLQEAEAPSSDVPAWLREEAPASGEAPAWLQEAEAPSSDVPAWLREEAPASGEAPAWLQEAEAPSSDVPAWSREEAPASSDVPAWLREE